MHAEVLEQSLRPGLLAAFAELLGPGEQHRKEVRERAGERSALAHPAILALAQSRRVRALVTPILGADAFAYRATLFDKTEHSNWPVAWHQDRVIPVAARHEVDGFSQWSQKASVWHVEPPLQVQQNVVAVRVDVDGSQEASGGLRLIPGSHQSGILTPAQVQDAATHTAVVCPKVVANGALRLRPLLLHSSQRTVRSGHRRIVHLEFFAGDLPGGVQFVRRVAALME